MTKLSISAVERDTGLSKDLLRAWERRYGFPCPERDASGDRLYPPDQLERLRLIRRLVDAGQRPGRLVALSPEALRAAADALSRRVEPAHGAAGQDTEPLIEELLSLVRALRADTLRRTLSQACLRQGLGGFVIGTCAPLSQRIGEAWARGELQVYEEHVFTEALQSVLRAAIGALPVASSGPKVLLATVPGEAHGLGLLMAEAMLALEACVCTSLGTQTPVVDIAAAARAHPTDIVALSFSSCLPLGQVLSGLSELRARLPAGIALWAGGGSPALRRTLPEGVTAIHRLDDIAERVGRWRAAARQAPTGSA